MEQTLLAPHPLILENPAPAIGVSDAGGQAGLPAHELTLEQPTAVPGEDTSEQPASQQHPEQPSTAPAQIALEQLSQPSSMPEQDGSVTAGADGLPSTSETEMRADLATEPEAAAKEQGSLGTPDQQEETLPEAPAQADNLLSQSDQVPADEGAWNEALR